MILAAGTLGTLLSSSAFAEDGDVTGGSATSKMSVQAQVEMLPMGSSKTTVGGISFSGDNKLAYGVTGMFDYAITPYLSIGVAPRLVLNVASDNPDGAERSDTGQQIDLRARIVGHYPVIPALQLYASLSPGYTIISSQDEAESAKGFAIAGAVGVTYDITPKLFINGEAGYQRAFTSADVMRNGQTGALDLDVSYMHVALGAGTRF
jgi:opacity protein-like surface antigen